jgi:hypothetical protein
LRSGPDVLVSAADGAYGTGAVVGAETVLGGDEVHSMGSWCLASGCAFPPPLLGERVPEGRVRGPRQRAGMRRGRRERGRRHRRRRDRGQAPTDVLRQPPPCWARSSGAGRRSTATTSRPTPCAAAALRSCS